MAIWLFGRKNKRHTLHLGATETRIEQLPAPKGSTLGYESHQSKKPASKHSKRRDDRHSLPAKAATNPSLLSTTVASDQSRGNHKSSKVARMSTAASRRYPPSNNERHTSPRERHSEDLTVHSQTRKGPYTMFQNGSHAKGKPSDNGPTLLKKKQSKRTVGAAAREQEIRLLSSSPIDIPRRRTQNPDGSPSSGKDQLRKRHLNHHLSDTSVSARNSAASSMADITATYMFKVNAFAALAPRPIVRYVGSQDMTAQNENSSTALIGKERVMDFPTPVENQYLKKTVDTLADSLDAGGLRELLERDRRRRERQHIHGQRRRQQKHEHNPEKVRLDDDRRLPEQHLDPAGRESERRKDLQRETKRTEDTPGAHDASIPVPKGPRVSRLRDASIGSHRNADMSLASVGTLGEPDSRPTRSENSGQTRSFAVLGGARVPLATPSHSPVRRELSTPGSSQAHGPFHRSTSSISRAESQQSDQDDGRFSTISSLIRRGSTRLKRSYRERSHEQRAKLPNPGSQESFSKPPALSPAPSAFAPPKAFLGVGTINRPHSRFTEHFTNMPASPPDSRLQSPDIPEEPINGLEPGWRESHTDLNDYAAEFAPFSDGDGTSIRTRGPDSVDLESENGVPLSRSLASVDSEGSWMSGDFLRRISRRAADPAQRTLGSLEGKLREHARAMPAGNLGDVLAEFSPSVKTSDVILDTWQATRGDAGSQIGSLKTDKACHGETRKRPILVTPKVRPRSDEGTLNDIRSLSPMSGEAVSPVEPRPAEHCL